MTSPLELDPEPRSVRDARLWVTGQLTRLGREDLLDAAQLGVSELVTNAILHAAPPIVVRLGGTVLHPRVEVHDSSTEPPSVRDMSDDARLLATIGRGLSIVSTYSRNWGAEMSLRGKVVWFEPASQDHPADLDEPVAGEIVDAVGPDDAAGHGDPSGDRLTIRLLGLPVWVFAQYRLWHDELRRELRLLALSHGTEHPVAQELSELTARVERELRQSRGPEQLDDAIRSGLDRVDVVYDVPSSVPGTIARLHEVLDAADEFCREQRLLTAAPTPQLTALRSWYLKEFQRQGRGEQPLPWPGGYTVEAPGR